VVAQPAAATPPSPPVIPQAPPPKPSQSISDELDAMDKGSTPPPKATVAPAKPSEPAKAPVIPPAKETPPPAKEEAAKPLVKDDDDPYRVPKAAKPAVTPPPETDTGPVKAPELRAAYATAKTKIAELEKKLAEVTTKPTGPDETERKTWTEKIGALEKQLSEVSDKLHFKAYEESPEFQQKYEAPFQQAWASGLQIAKQLTVMGEDGAERLATDEDFATVMTQPNWAKANSLAKDIFGDNANLVMAQRLEIQKAYNAKLAALQDHRGKVSELTKKEQEEADKSKQAQEQQRIQATVMFNKFNADAVAKHPEWFAPAEGDEEGNKLLQDGFDFVDLTFSKADRPDMKTAVLRHSQVRNQAAAFDRLTHRLALKDGEIAKLQEEIKELRSSGPPPGQERGVGSTPGEVSAMDELDALDRKNR